MITAEKNPHCNYCEATQQFANKIGDSVYRTDAARQYLAIALIHLCRELGDGMAAGHVTVETAKILKALQGVQQGTRRTMNGPLPHSRRGDQPVLPKRAPAERTPEEIALILRVVAGTCEELARIEPDGSHSKRALSDLALLADGWITPQSLGYDVPDDPA